MTIAELKEMIDNNDWDIKYSRFGIRIQEQPFELGAMDHNSKVWLDFKTLSISLDFAPFWA